MIPGKHGEPTQCLEKDAWYLNKAIENEKRKADENGWYVIRCG